MGGRRVEVLDHAPPRNDPRVRIVDEGGLWSFELHECPGADVVLVLLPAMGVPARYYDSFAEELLRCGVAVLRADFLADQVVQNSSRPLDGFASLVEGCIPAIFDVLETHEPNATPVIVGHSLGGQLGLVAAARFAPEISLVLVASGSAWHRAFGGARRWLYRGGSQAIHGVARMLGYWPGDVMGFGGRQPLALIRDWSSVVRTGQYRTTTGTFDYEATLPRYCGKILAIDVTGDVLAPPTATDALLEKAPAAHVDRYSYAAARGLAKPGAHFTWARDRSDLTSVIVSWVRTRRLPTNTTL